jgi:ankyrin repeat protein
VTNANGFTPLHVACLKGHLGIVRLLLASGADLTVTSVNSKTPLHLACEQGHTDVVQELLDKGANVSVTSAYGISV